ncbi:hypothetical protein NNG48_07265 [Enterococcus faecium]|nr:hypothetical protein [Enterococcus faecium]
MTFREFLKIVVPYTMIVVINEKESSMREAQDFLIGGSILLDEEIKRITNYPSFVEIEI